MDGNAALDIEDVQQILNFFALNPGFARPGYADVNRDGTIDNSDAQIVVSFLLEDIGTLPWEP
jgi:hypothetical protein